MLDFIVDYFGLIVWIYLVVISGIDLLSMGKKSLLKMGLLVVGVVGILLDSVLLSLGFFWNLSGGWMFDVLGLVVFPYVIFIAYSDLENKKICRWVWTKWGLLIMGVGGLFLDLFVIFYNLG